MNAPVRLQPSEFVKLGLALGWSPKTMVLVKNGYFDESIEFDPKTKRPVNMTIGGCIASFEDWQGFDSGLAKILEAEGLSLPRDMFHMADFEAYQKPFDWFLPDGIRDHERHKRVLNSLLDLMLSHSRIYIGTNVFPLGRDTAKTYEKCVLDMMMECAEDGRLSGDCELALVFASHPELSEVRYQKIFAEVKALYPHLHSCSVADPHTTLPLQAADIAAYEFHQVQRVGHKGRYPLKQIAARSEACFITTKWDAALAAFE